MSGRIDVEVAQVQPLRGEVADHRARPGIGQHPPDLPFEHRRLVELPGRGDLEQFIVRDAAPQEERQP